MEKRTMGSFIAALRKTKGLTQKELAELLSVSDKSVSRWERDECYPDLTLIPVIAEIFEITSDELLRGERINNTNTTMPRENKKTEKQIKNILNTKLTNFKIHSIISFGTAIFGLIAAMIFNAFNFAYLGFFIACLFYLTSVIYEVIVVLRVFSSANSDEFDKAIFFDYKKTILKWMLNVLGAIFIVFGFSLPLILVPDMYMGISFDDWFISGLGYSLIYAVVYFTVYVFIIIAVNSKYSLNMPIEKVKNDKLKAKCISITLVILTVLFLVQFTVNLNTQMIQEISSQVYDNFEEFKEFAESNDPYGLVAKERQHVALESKNGEILYEFDICNNAVIDVEYGDIENDYLPITVSYYSSVYQSVGPGVNIAFLLAYIIVIGLAFFIYFKRRVKIQKKGQDAE